MDRFPTHATLSQPGPFFLRSDYVITESVKVQRQSSSMMMMMSSRVLISSSPGYQQHFAGRLALPSYIPTICPMIDDALMRAYISLVVTQAGSISNSFSNAYCTVDRVRIRIYLRHTTVPYRTYKLTGESARVSRHPYELKGPRESRTPGKPLYSTRRGPL